MKFEIGWYYFLTSEYNKAIGCFNEVIPVMNDIVGSDRIKRFVKESIFRNLGLCYDMLGQRDKAVQNYIKGEKLLKELNSPDWKFKGYYRDYKNIPYKKKDVKNY
jgi:tetratricopeptide (TPR) repeat protein